MGRVLEEHGISTIIVTNIPDLLRQTKAPRGLAVKYPYGQPLGAPGNIEAQRKIILDGFHALETITEPGTIIPLSYPYRKSWLS